MTRQVTAPAVTFGVLGPVTAMSDHGPVPLRGLRQRAVLARLLIARGRVVPVDRLVDDLWAVPPDGAVAAIRTFVSDLRRALEPDRAPRQPARLLRTTPPGYTLRTAPDAVDAGRFETSVGESGRLLAAGHPGPAQALLTEALALWRGPAYAEFAGEAWTRAEIDRLDGLRMLAVERRAEALLALGRAAEAASDLQSHTSGNPLREDAWHLLATALYRAGRQGEALAALRRARRTLVAELGLDPGPRLRQLEADILAQAAHLDPPAPAPATPPPTTHRSGPHPDAAAGPDRLPSAPAARPDGSRVGVPGPERPFVGRRTGGAEDARPFVGRSEELAHLEQAARDAVRRDRATLALLSGEPGSGKTALAEALARRLAAAGWTTAWGRAPEYPGAPVAWPWTQILDALPGPADPGPTPEPGPPEAEDPAVFRFRLRQATLSRLAAVAERHPLLLVVDDLHRADDGTLDLLTALVAEPAPAVGPVLIVGPVLVVGTYRATEITPELTAALARGARAEPVRVGLVGLTEAATGELAAAVAGRTVDASTAHLIHQRSGGNPFFVRELARLLADEGAAALRKVPAGVRDVIRHRLAGLPDPVRNVLQQAAVLGRDIDPDVLVAVADDPAATLDALDGALRAGFLTEDAPDRRPRFTHILVRDTLYDGLSTVRRAHWHAAAAEAIERLHPDDVLALAHHFDAAANRATAPRAARYARAAAERAEQRSAPHEAVRLWRQVLTAHDRAGDGDVPGRLGAVMGLGRTLAVTGALAEARRYRARAVATVDRLGDPELTAEIVAAFEVPAIWPRNDDEELSRQIVRTAEHALAVLPEHRWRHRSRLLSTIALELRGTGTDRGRRAADEAAVLARRAAADDPALLALALNARFMHTFQRTGLADERARIGAELVDLAARHRLVTFEVLGHLILLQAHCALGDIRAAGRHSDAAAHLARRYELPSVDVFTRWYAALRLAAEGRLTEAEVAYRAAAVRLDRGGMPGMSDGLLPLALLSLRLLADERSAVPPDGPSPESAAAPPDGPDRKDGRPDLTDWESWAWGPDEPWVRPLLLVFAGRPEEAAAALSAVPESPHDLLREVRLCLTARAALALGDHAMMAYVHAELRPAAAEVAAGSGVLTLGPVSRYLRDLDAALAVGKATAPHPGKARRR